MTTSRRLVPASLIVAAALGLLLWATPGAEASDLEVPHVGLVPEIPRIDFPDVLDGNVYAVSEVGHWIVVGGDFQQVQLQDGTIITQPHLVAYDRDTGAFVPEFDPAPNNPVHAITEGLAGDEVFVGGQFNNIGGRPRSKLAKLSLPDGTVDATWIANVSAVVTDIEITPDNRMFVGGSFKKVKGNDHDNVVELDPVTGDVVAGFNFAFTGEGGSRSGGQHIKHLEATPDGDTLVVVHSALNIDGNQRRGAATFDISTQGAASLTSWSMNSFWIGAPQGANPTDADLSPDGTFFSMSTIVGNSPPWHDTTVTMPVAGGPNTSPLWTHAMRDSVYAIGISNNAVYVGGHFCRIASGPGPTNNDGLVKTCTGSAQAGAWRWQIAALDPADGTPLDWDPGSNSFHGVEELTVTDRGLLLGHDGSQLNNRTVGRAGFFDFGPGVLDSSGPTVTIAAPIAGALMDSPVTLAGTATDDYRAQRVRLRLFNTATSQYVQADGTLDAALHEFIVGPEYGDPGTTVPWGMQQSAPDGPYRVTAWAIDPVGNQSSSVQVDFTIGDPPPLTCTATLDGATGVDLVWDPIPGENNYNIRRDGGFVTNTSALTYNDPNPGPGDHSYLIRSNMGGVTTDVVCQPNPITVSPPMFGCTATLDGANGVNLAWDPIPGEDNHIVRRDGGFVSVVGNFATTYNDANPGAGNHSYLIRSVMGGVTTDIPCTPDPITVPPPMFGCTATLDGGAGVNLAWDPIPGEDVYVIRRDNTFLGTVGGGGLSYNDPNPSPGPHSYVVRSFMGGVATDIPCSPDPIDVPPPVLVCTATPDGNGGVDLVWDPVIGEDLYIIRRDNAFLGTVGGGGLSYNDPAPAPGDHSYLIRSRMAGVTTNVPCTPDPITV